LRKNIIYQKLLNTPTATGVGLSKRFAWWAKHFTWWESAGWCQKRTWRLLYIDCAFKIKLCTIMQFGWHFAP